MIENDLQSTYEQIKALVREHFPDDRRASRLIAIAAALLRQVESGNPSQMSEIHDMARRLEDMLDDEKDEVDVTLG